MHSFVRSSHHAEKVITYARKLVLGPSWARSITTTPFPEFSDLSQLKTHDDLHKFSLENPQEFWGRLARSRLRWDQDFQTVHDCSLEDGKIAWFLGGKLNASGNLGGVVFVCCF